MNNKQNSETMKKIKIEIWEIEPIIDETYPEYNSGYYHNNKQIVDVTEEELSTIDTETHDFRKI